MLLEAGGAKVVYTETSDQCSQVPLLFLFCNYSNKPC